MQAAITTRGRAMNPLSQKRKFLKNLDSTESLPASAHVSQPTTNQPTGLVQQDVPFPMALTSARMREIQLSACEPATRELMNEIHRLHTLIRRADFLLTTLRGNNSQQLDITSSNLLASLAIALWDEPA